MALLFNCPLPAMIDSIDNVDCSESLDQIVRIIFQRIRDESNNKNLLPLGNYEGKAVVNKSELDILLTATDRTKMQFTPILENLAIPASEAIIEGGGSNETPFGQPRVSGENPVAVETPRFANLASTIRDQLKQYESESANFAQLGIFYVNEYNRLIGDARYLKEDAVSATAGTDQIVITLGTSNVNQYTVGEMVSVESTPAGDFNGTYPIESVDAGAGTITLTAVAALGTDTQATIVAGGLAPIPIQSLYISSPMSDGFGTQTFTMMRYSKTSQWAKNLKIVDVNPNDFVELYSEPNP